MMSPDEMLEHARRIAGGGKGMSKEEQRAFMQTLLPALEPVASEPVLAEPPAAQRSVTFKDLGLDGPSPALVQVSEGGSIAIEHVPSILSPADARGLAGTLIRAALTIESPQPKTEEEVSNVEPV